MPTSIRCATLQGGFLSSRYPGRPQRDRRTADAPDERAAATAEAEDELMAAGMAGAIKAKACCGDRGHFASVHHGGGGGRPGGSSCAAPDCDCEKLVEGIDARVPLGKDNLTAAEVRRLLGLSVHTLSYWRQSDQGPRTIKAGARTLYRRADVELWLAEIDGHSEPLEPTERDRLSKPISRTDWYEKAVAAAERIETAHTAPWKLATAYALLSIAESLRSRQIQPGRREPVMSSETCKQSNGEVLTLDEVAELTRLSKGTLRYWRAVGEGGPKSFKLGRRIMYRRADVENWLERAK